MSSATIVLELQQDDVLFLRDLLSECVAQCNREYSRASRRPGFPEWRAGWRGRGDDARSILKEIKRQERAWRKAMRDGNDE